MSAKHAALAYAVNQERDRRLGCLTVMVNGVRFDADPSSVAYLTGFLAAQASGISVPWPKRWRDANNEFQLLTYTDAQALAAMMVVAVERVLDASWHLKDTVIPALDLAGVQACDVTADTWWAP